MPNFEKIYSNEVNYVSSTFQEQTFLPCTSGSFREQKSEMKHWVESRRRNSKTKSGRKTNWTRLYIFPSKIRAATNAENIRDSVQPSQHHSLLFSSGRHIHTVKKWNESLIKYWKVSMKVTSIKWKRFWGDDKDNWQVIQD